MIKTVRFGTIFMALLLALPQSLMPMIRRFAQKGFSPMTSSFTRTPYTAQPMRSLARPLYTPTNQALRPQLNFLEKYAPRYEHSFSSYNNCFAYSVAGICLAFLFKPQTVFAEPEKTLPEPVRVVKDYMAEFTLQENSENLSYYADRIIPIVQEHRAEFAAAYPDFDIDQLIQDLEDIKKERSIYTIIKKLYNYWPLLPDEFWNLSYWTQYKRIQKKLG